ncbi:hypothetical protein H101_08175, partial [Trichophyton interdigitale H6]
MALNRVGDDNLYIGGFVYPSRSPSYTPSGPAVACLNGHIPAPPGQRKPAAGDEPSAAMHILHIANQNILYYRVYASRLMALNNKLALERENITHTLTVLRINVDEERFKPFKEHLHIPVDDVDDEDLLQHFPTTNAFIRSGLESGTGGVLVHWYV